MSGIHNNLVKIRTKMADFGMNLRVTMDSKQGGRKYMEDVLSVKFQKTEDGRNIEYTYLAVFDGHGGSEAAKFAKEHLLDEITKLKGFWSNNDEEVQRAIRDGFLATHKLMWKAFGKVGYLMGENMKSTKTKFRASRDLEKRKGRDYQRSNLQINIPWRLYYTPG